MVLTCNCMGITINSVTILSGETICLIGFVIVRKRERDKRKNEV